MQDRSATLPRAIATLMRIGYINRIPATPFGSAAGIGLWVGIHAITDGSLIAQGGLFAAVLAIGSWGAAVHVRQTDGSDPQEIIVDETCGMLLALIGVPFNIPFLFMGWVLFHIFDVTKIYPASRAERLGGHIGVMADDLVAGLYTGILLHLGSWALP